MPCITTERKTTLEADLVDILADIAAISAGIQSLALSGTKSYSFDSGTGRASEVFTDPIRMIQVRTELKAQRDLIQRQLNGTAVVRQVIRT